MNLIIEVNEQWTDKFDPDDYAMQEWVESFTEQE